MNADLSHIEFHGDLLWTAELDGAVFVVIKSICERLGIAWNKQLERMKRDPIMVEGMTMMVIPSPGGVQETTLLRLDLLNGWLFGIDEGRVKDEETRQRVLTYKRECYRVLFEHFFARPREAPPAVPVETYEAESLASRVSAVEAARRLYGRAAARELWVRLGLPALGGAIGEASPGMDEAGGRACLARLLSAELVDADGLVLPVRAALKAPGWRPVLEAAGILPAAGGAWVANRSTFLDQLFAGTAWSAGAWRHALRCLPGSHGLRGTNVRQFAGRKGRATWVPTSALET
ncbi:phage antirepressor N-terminal domain-containing protein [Ancylobacter terrae]|uniref:phage antirepressor N-terminal domain-containing protein n=1 Tax=Ancylobacter sp. sgz301288 TaxID=3342077 RepID=UPI00385C55E6